MISASHITYYHLCHRKLWLHHRGMRMEDNIVAVAEGKWIGRTTYQERAKRWRELDLGSLKIDFFDRQHRLVREIKRSPKLEFVHVAQVQYYLFELERRGFIGVSGLIEYPKQRLKKQVELTDSVRKAILSWEAEIRRIVEQNTCPELVRKPICKRCAFQSFCYV